MSAPRDILIPDLDDLAVGAAMLGTGGGGDPYIGKLMTAEAIRRFGPVRMIAPEDLADDALVLPVGMMGAPTVMVEKIPSGREVLDTLATLEQHLGRTLDAVMPTEIGGLNSIIALVAAATRGVPVVDCDMVGRAFPELQMCTPSLFGTAATPLALADDKGNTSVITTVSNRWAERIARAATIEMGCWSMVTLYPMSGAQVKAQTIHGTLSLVMRIGRSIHDARRAGVDPIRGVLDATGGFHVWTGKVRDVRRRTVGGFARGEVVIEGIDACAGDDLRIDFQNEFLIARTSERTLVTTPDLITILDAETAEPITTETMRYGFRVAVIAIPGDPYWRSPAGLEVVGPRWFGYDEEFSPVEGRPGFIDASAQVARA
jgi:DUF917 family protein